MKDEITIKLTSEETEFLLAFLTNYAQQVAEDIRCARTVCEKIVKELKKGGK